MANIDKKGNNRFTNAASSEDAVNQIDNNDIVLNILKDEFPDDPFFAQDMLGPLSEDGQALDAIESDDSTVPDTLAPGVRNTKNILNVSTERDEYAKYNLAKTFPTIDEDALDDIIDEEWNYFEDPDGDDIVSVEALKPSGLFVVNSDVDLRDMHDLYINAGPQTIEENEVDITNKVFCVFFIQNGIAYVIPTYKTLEVMLVQRGLTYDAIQEATAEQAKEFDLTIDGVSDDEFLEAPSPIEEFRNRSYPVLDSNWNYSLRFRSGYRPKAPFVRDPGDYIKPESVRSQTGRSKPESVNNVGSAKSANSAEDSRELIDTDGNVQPQDVYYDLDKNDRYFDQVFQKQTYREKLRSKFEGKMIIGDWPSPIYKDEEVGMGTEIVSDDAVRNLRIMINGHWKFLSDGAVMKLYAYLNDYDISEYVQGQGRYGTNGYIQLLINAGGCTVIQAGNGDAGTNDTQTGDSDMANKVEPLWNAFPHIIEADDDNAPGVDKIEYQEYLDHFTNGGEPFGIEYLQPYEPAGSIKYYHKQQYQDLVAQSVLQGEIDVIKDQIYEIWPEVASLIQNTKIQFDALPTDFSSYVVNKLGVDSPLYKVMLSKSGKWKYVKKKSGSLKDKYSHNRLFKLCSKKLGIKLSLSEDQELKFVNDYKWMQTVHRDKFAAWMNGGTTAAVIGVVPAAYPGTVLAASIGSAAAATSTAAAAIPALAAGTNIIGVAPVVTAVPSLGSFMGAMLTNPITIGAAAAVGIFFAIDAIAGEVPADEYDLPPWRFMEEEEYLQSCILNEIDDNVEAFKLAADAADTNLPWAAGIVNELYSGMGNIDTAILDAASVEEFQQIFEYIQSIQGVCDNLNDGGLFTHAVNLRKEIDIYLKDQLKRQYNAIQFLRKKVYSTSNAAKKKEKYGIVWPAGPQNILNEFVPGCIFDNYIPKVD